MALEFNPLDYPQSLSLPKRFGTTASHEHIPFIKLLVHLMRPKTFVELGVGKGESYLAMCEAISALGMKISSFGIDTWKSDADQVALANLRVQHDAAYGQFSRLVESTFDEAAAHFSEGSVELLHIDGNHNYEAVCHDWETFRPKMSRSGVVLFHFTNRREGDYGVWKLWEQLRSTYRHFEFLHGHGLGVLALSPGISESLNVFLTMAEKNPGVVRSYFFALGSRITLHAKAGAELAALQGFENRIQQFETKERGHAEELERAAQLSQSRASESDALRRSHDDEVAALTRKHDDELAARGREHADAVAKHELNHGARVTEIETLTGRHALAIEALNRAHADERQVAQQDHEAELARLQSSLFERTALSEKLDQLNRQRADEIDALNTNIRARAAEIEALQRTSAAHVDEIEELNRLCQIHSDEAEGVAQVSAARAAGIAKLESAARVQTEAVEALKRQCKAHETEAARLEGLVKARTDDTARLERLARERSAELDAKARLFKTQFDETENTARAHADALSSLQRTHSDAIAALQRTRADERAKVERAMADEAAKLDRLGETRASDIERLNAKIDEREESVRSRDVELLLQQDKVEKLQAELAELREAKTRLESDPSFKLGHTLLAPFRFFSDKRTTTKALPAGKQASPGTKS